MYRILLADDEGIVLNSLSYIIEKNFEGQFEIETAKSGRSAIETAERFRPDVIFMDIQMPGINGIDAMREIRQNLPTAIFIVLTAYDKFDYAKEAINLGVLDYLNKPFNQKAITEVLNVAIKELDTKREKRREDLKTRERLETVVPIIENGFISNIIFSEPFDEDVENYKNLLSIEEAYGYMLAVVFGDNQNENHMTNAVGSSVKAQTIYYTKVRQMLKDSFPEAIVGSVSSNKIPVFIKRANTEMSLNERSDLIEKSRFTVRQMRNATDIHFRIGIGGIKKIKNCRASFEEAIKALYLSDGSVAHALDLPTSVTYEENYPADLENEIFDKLHEKDTDGCLLAAGSFFDWMIEKYADDFASVKLKALEFVLRAESDMYRDGGHTYTFASRKDYWSELSSISDAVELKKWYMNKMTTAANNISSGSSDHTHHLIRKALNFIDEHYKDEITLNDISDNLNISSYYFSKLFKDETGEGFVEYLTRIRIDKAKDMMKDPQKSIKEIAIECGYSDANYFSRIFKKASGYTPTEYKERLGSGL